MKSNIRTQIKSGAITVLILLISYAICVFLQNVLAVGEHVTTVFVVGVFLISLLTDGYFYGIFSAFAAVFAINFAFTLPFFAFNFTIPENFLSALVMIVISLGTSALTTRLKKWQRLRALGEREMMRANLLRAVSHDIRTPLTTIYGAGSALLEHYDTLTDAQKKKMIQGITEDSDWLIRMVENLLSVTRIDSGSVELIKTPTALEELIDSVLLKFKKRYPDRTIDVDLPDETVIIPMDALLIEQVLINILENAVRHAKGMTRLSLRIIHIDGKAIFEVADNGCGIPRDRLEHLFDPLAHLDVQSTDNRQRGFGIGLSVCAAIIHAHAGSIRAENAKGGGAIFRFSLNTDTEKTEEPSDDEQ